MNIIEAEYPISFDIEEFKQLDSYKKRIEYAKKHLSKIGSGSARIVFDIDEDTVFKLARNKKGLLQNDLEKDISSTGWYDCIAKVLDADPKHLWIEAEKAKKINKSQFKKMTGFSFEDWMDALYIRHTEINHSRGGAGIVIPDGYHDILETDLFNEVMQMIQDMNLLVGDFRRINSWGVVDRDGEDFIVLVDYGTSKEIWKDYYMKKT